MVGRPGATLLRPHAVICASPSCETGQAPDRARSRRHRATRLSRVCFRRGWILLESDEPRPWSLLPVAADAVTETLRAGEHDEGSNILDWVQGAIDCIILSASSIWRAASA